MKKTLLLPALITRLLIAGAQDAVIPAGKLRKFSVTNSQLDIDEPGMETSW